MKKFIIDSVVLLLTGLFIIIYFELPSYLIPILNFQLITLLRMNESTHTNTIIQIKKGEE